MYIVVTLPDEVDRAYAEKVLAAMVRFVNVKLAEDNFETPGYALAVGSIEEGRPYEQPVNP